MAVATEAKPSIGLMRPEHVATVARLHRETFPDELLPQLGPAVMDVLYRSYLDSPRGVAVAATQDGEVAGFATGAIGPGFVREVVRRHWKLIAAAALRAAVRSPRLLRELTAVTQRLPDPFPGDPARRFYWRILVVAPAWRGQRLAMPLVRAILLEARRRGAHDVFSPVYDYNRPSIRLHEILGFESYPAAPGLHFYRLELARLGEE